MMKIKAVVSHLLLTIASALFRLQASPLVVQKFPIKIDNDPEIRTGYKKGPPG